MMDRIKLLTCGLVQERGVLLHNPLGKWVLFCRGCVAQWEY